MRSLTRPASPTPSTTTTACSLKTTTPTPTLTLTTTAMQMLPLMAATSFEHRGLQCLLTLGRSTSPPLDQFPLRVCSCPLCIMNRLCSGSKIPPESLEMSSGKGFVKRSAGHTLVKKLTGHTHTHTHTHTHRQRTTNPQPVWMNPDRGGAGSGLPEIESNSIVVHSAIPDFLDCLYVFERRSPTSIVYASAESAALR